MSMQLHHTLMSQYKHGTASGIGSVSYESVANCVTPEVVIYGKCVQDSYTGKNLFDVNNAKIIQAYLQVEADGAGTLAKSDACVSVYIPCKPNTTYTVSKISSQRFGVCFTSSIPEVGGNFSNGSLYDTATKATRTAPSDAAYIVVWVYNSLIDTDITADKILASLQIEVGETATEYEPYVGGVASPNPLYPQDIVCNRNAYVVNGVNAFIAPELYAVGNVRDEYYPLTGKIIRRCGAKEIKASWQYPPDGTTTLEMQGKSFCFDLPGSAVGYNTSVCSHFEYVDNAWLGDYKGRYGIYSDHPTVTARYFRAPNESVTTVAQFQAWLNEQKAAGTPVILVYQLASPVIEYVDPVQITSARGANIIEETDLNSKMFGIPFVEGTQIDVKYLTHS